MTDSTNDTLDHIREVRNNLLQVTNALEQRALHHDASKLLPPEKAAFDKLMELKLSDTEYGSEEYKAALRQVKPEIEHHYAENSHHPEHYPDGYIDMDLLDIIEMLADWKAATMRMRDGGDLRKSIMMNQERFGYTDEARQILLNTAFRLGWLS